MVGYSAEEVRAANEAADVAAGNALTEIWEEGAVSRASQAVVRKWTQEALLRLHDGFARQRELAGLTNEFSPDPAPRGGVAGTREGRLVEEGREGPPGPEAEAPEPTR